MEIFKIRPSSDIIDARDLYLRIRSGTADLRDGVCMLPPYSEISTDTYFNIFSSSKYAEYTRAEEIVITTSVSGKILIKLCSFFDGSEQIIESKSVDSEDPVDVRFSFRIGDLKNKTSTSHYLVYRSYGESFVHSFGSYVTDLEPDPVDLGVAICTFRREERVIKTLSRINQIMSDKGYGLNGKVTVYVVDNGRTLKKESIKFDYVKLIPNKNNGGSGGFTRGIIESKKDNKTHILLMDDDVELDPNVIYKTFNLISILNDRHKKTFVLGGMLLSEKPNIQYEAGTEYLQRFRRGKHMLDLSDIDALLQNDKWEPADYGGWWYMCMPKDAADELPLPLFIKFDDVEFGLRRMRDHIVMNGIGIWHDSFESKNNPVVDYYFLRRNTLILHAIYGKRNGISTGIGHLSRMLRCIKEKKSNEYIYTRRAVNDFLKGPEFIENAEQTDVFEMIDETDDKALPTKNIKKRESLEIFGRAPDRELLSLLRECAELMTKWNKITKKYRDSIEYLSSHNFWEGGAE